MKYHILLLSDEISFKNRVEAVTEKFAYIYAARSIHDGLFHLTTFFYQLIIVDRMQDIGHSYKIIKTIRKFSKMLILAIVLDNTKEKLMCIENGADFVITKSAKNTELGMQIYALVRRQKEWTEDKELDSNVQQDGLSINYMFRQAYWKGNKLKLSKHEYEFLYLIASTPGRVYTFEQIYQVVWGDYSHGNIDNMLWCLVKRIRKKLNELEHEAGSIIQNIPKTGYCLRIIDSNVV